MLSVGDIFRKERERQGITLDQVEKKIKVRKKLLEAIEINDWVFFSSKVYIIGIIKNYSNFLGLDQKKILAFFRRDYEKREEIKFKKRIPSKYLNPETKKIIFIGFGLLISLFVIYFGYQLKLYFSPPKISIILPTSDTVVKKDKVRIVGETEKEAVINIFGDRIFQNKEGVFEYDFPLNEAKNELVVEVIGANGKKTILKKYFYRKN